MATFCVVSSYCVFNEMPALFHTHRLIIKQNRKKKSKMVPFNERFFPRTEIIAFSNLIDVLMRLRVAEQHTYNIYFFVNTIDCNQFEPNEMSITLSVYYLLAVEIIIVQLNLIWLSALLKFVVGSI